jgi:hypothetical protein
MRIEREQTCTAKALQVLNRAFDMGLASAEGQKLESNKGSEYYIQKYYENVLNPLCIRAIQVFDLNQALLMCIPQYLWFTASTMQCQNNNFEQAVKYEK